MQSSYALGPKGASRKTVVLLVDDQVIVGEAVRRMLADQSDIEFHFCANPFEALDKAAELKPTVILQDLVMPDIEGPDLFEENFLVPYQSRDFIVTHYQ